MQRSLASGSRTDAPLSSHSLRRRTLLASVSASFSVSPAATAASTSTPLPMDETTSLSTVTDADSTLCIIAGPCKFQGQQLVCRARGESSSRPTNLSYCLAVRNECVCYSAWSVERKRPKDTVLAGGRRSKIVAAGRSKLTAVEIKSAERVGGDLHVIDSDRHTQILQFR